MSDSDVLSRRQALGLLVKAAPATAEEVVAAGTGWMAASKAERTLSVGQSIQGAIRGDRGARAADEYAKYVDAGAIKDDFDKTQQGWDCIQELLRAIDSESFSEEQFQAAKNVFLGLATETVTSRGEVLGYELMKAATHLESMEVLVMRACWQVHKVHYVPGLQNTSSIGKLNLDKKRAQITEDYYRYLGISEEVSFLAGQAADSLNSKSILVTNTPTAHNHYPQFIIRAKGQFTTFGYKLAELLHHQEQAEEPTQTEETES